MQAPIRRRAKDLDFSTSFTNYIPNTQTASIVKASDDLLENEYKSFSDMVYGVYGKDISNEAYRDIVYAIVNSPANAYEFEKALDEIEPLKATDKDAYDKAYQLISAEIISPIYMLLNMYRENYSLADYDALAKEFKYYVSKSGVEFHADGMECTMEDLYNSLGI